MKKIRNRFTGDTIESESIEYCNNGEIARYIYTRGVSHTQLFVSDGWEEVKEDNSSIEEAAKKYTDWATKGNNGDKFNFANGDIKETFITAAIWMRDSYLKEDNQWHDLEKNPDDLPDDGRDVFVAYVCENGQIETDNAFYYRQDGIEHWAIFHNVLAWAELPKFKRE